MPLPDDVSDQERKSGVSDADGERYTNQQLRALINAGAGLNLSQPPPSDDVSENNYPFTVIEDQQQPTPPSFCYRFFSAMKNCVTSCCEVQDVDEGLLDTQARAFRE